MEYSKQRECVWTSTFANFAYQTQQTDTFPCKVPVLIFLNYSLILEKIICLKTVQSIVTFCLGSGVLSLGLTEYQVFMSVHEGWLVMSPSRYQLCSASLSQGSD